MLALVAVLGSLAFPGASSAAPALGAPGGFKLRASNGYAMRVWAVPARQQRPAGILVVVGRKGSSVTYSAPATVTETSIQANLGELGEIDVSFHPSGQAKSEHPVCSRRRVAFDSGFYEGTIKFDGEEGYAQVDATRATGDLQFALDLICPGGGSSGSGPGVPGAELRIDPRGSRQGVSLEAKKNRPGGRAHFGASIEEVHAGIAISRAIGAWGPPTSFDYDPMLSSATVAPPAPFSGHATYRRNAKPPNRWTGTLSVDFPGHSDVSLTRGNLHIGLIRGWWEHLQQPRTP